MATEPAAGGQAGISETDWATLLLADVGAPTTTNNIDNIERWMTAEEPTSDWFDRNNPLNASLGTSSTDGTGSYSDLEEGAQETAAMIGQDDMGAIYAALMANAPTQTFADAVEDSPWAGSHYADDPIQNIPVPGGNVLSTGQTLGGTGSTGSSSGGSSSGLLNKSMLVRIAIGFGSFCVLLIAVSHLMDRGATPAEVIVPSPQPAPPHRGLPMQAAEDGAETAAA